MLIGIFVLYIQFSPLYDLDIIPWRYILLNKLQPGTLSQKEYMELMHNLWNIEDQRLLEWLKKDVLSGTNLSRPDPSIRLYINTDWSKDGMGAVLLQSYVSTEARNLEAKEKDGGSINFTSPYRRNVSTTNLFHININGVVTGNFKT